MRKLAGAALAAALCFSLAACAWLFPKKAALDTVHDAYRADFRKFVFAQPEKLPCEYSDAFDQSLEAIRGFETRYANDTGAEMAHVTVLKAMIHLQGGHFGVARTMIPALDKLTISASDDREIRDAIFKDAYGPLVNGWQAACESVKASTPTVVTDGPFTADGKTRQRSDVLDEAASGIKAQLDAALKKRSQPGLESDDGAIYVATSASIFRYYVFRIKSDGCRLNPDQAACIRPYTDLLTSSMEVLKARLTAEEIAAVEARDACAKQPPPGWHVPSQSRQRYVAWYLTVKKAATCP